ncbi:CLUMA_CG004903, isoform A [Clunio marinus]|uniref:Regucalcin n=1 Tax=Clunio marinus TaxID=568069 RepID=A0A1J1HV36_9DIPT|nr:CLUMA_CG004903, isoform A [Clunio marinus]
MSQADMKIEELTNEAQRGELLEGPHWDVERQSLYYVDIVAPAIFRYDYKNGEIYRATIKDNNAAIGFFIPVEGTTDEFVIGANREVLLIKWDGKSSQASISKVLVEVDKAFSGNRCNDGKVDPSGVLFFGTMGDESKYDLSKTRVGSFYRFKDSTTGAFELKNEIGISNGLTWDETNKKFFYIDSVTRDVKVYDYNQTTSEISNESILIDFSKSHSGSSFAPDGMTIDENGIIYVATWNGSRIIVINPITKKIIQEIPMPTAQVTSLAFGGPNFDILFVTTAGKPKPKLPPAGGLFKITGLGVKGLPMKSFKHY